MMMTESNETSTSSDFTTFLNLTTIVPDTTSVFLNSTENVTVSSELNQTIQSSWNVSKLINNITDIKKTILEFTQSTTEVHINTTKTTRCTTTSTENPFGKFDPPEGIEYIFVPLGVMVFVVILSAVVLIISRKRKLEQLRHRLMPLYNFDPDEEGEDDWETELLDEGFDSRQRRGYRSMDTEENAELFGRH
ncbi:uncharacterized protein C3orf18 homolog [Cephus cinctus]|uniref:Uncharacterized protein C3orf18 homolog n=1 Tax=Cephus cinctus TaxID=211228 RepID=A0AAJ7BZP9_CEPCN|nr:uncharacterized protein C3orf18 homolog [Cephus cinctus]